MADTFERLGIQLELEPLKGDPTQALATLKKTLSEIADVMKGLNLDKLGNIKMDGLSSELNKAKGSAKDVKDGLEQTAEAVAKVGERAKLAAQELQKVGSTWREFLTANKEVALAKVGGDWEQAQKLMSNFYRQWKSEAKSSSQQVEDDNKKVKSSLAETMKFEEDKNKQRAYIIRQQQQDEDKRHSLAIRNAEQEKAQWEKFRQFVERETQSTGRTQAIAFGMNEKATLSYNSYANRDADGAYKAYLKNLEDVKNQELKILTERGQQTLAIIRNTEKAQKSELDKASKDWSEYLNALNKQGLKYFNGDVVPKSYVTNIGAAQAQALKYNESLSLPNANQFKEALSSLAPLKASLTDIKNAIGLTGQEIRNLPADKLQQLRTALAPFKVSINETTGELKKMKTAMDWLPESMQKMGARLAEFYSLRTVIFAVSNQFREAVAGAIDFNQNIRDIAAIAGSSRAEMDGIGESILTIAKNSRFSANEVAGLMQVLAQAGIKAKDLGEVSNVVGQFATATASKPEVAADVFTTTMTVFKKEASESTTIANALTAALNNSKLTTEGLATAFNYLAPQAAQFGLTMEQTLGIVAGMSQAGVKASTIGTGTSQLMKELAVPKERLRNLLDYYSIKAEEVNPKLHTFAEVVETLNSAVGRSGEKGVQAEHLFAALESRVGRSIVTAVTLGADAFTNMTNSITGTNAATVAFEKTMEGPRAKINVLKQEVLSLVVSIGNALGPTLAGITDILTGAVRGLSTIQGTFIGAAAASGVLAVAIRTLTVAALANPIIAGVTGGILAITLALNYFGKETDETIVKSQEQRKAFVELAESTQRVKDVTSAAIVESERKNKSLKAYTDLLKGNKQQQEQANTLGREHVDINAETKKSLAALKDSHKDWFANIDLENLKLVDLYAILKKVNDERARGTHEAVKTYNELKDKENALAPKVEAERARQTSINKGSSSTGFFETLGVGWKEHGLNPNALPYQEKRLKKIRGEADEIQKTLAAEVLSSDYKKDDKTGKWELKTQADKDNDARIKAELAKKRKANDRIPDAGSKGSAAKAENYLDTVEKEIAKGEADAAKQLMETYRKTLKDVDVAYELREAAYEKASTANYEEYMGKWKENNVRLGMQFAAANKGAKYNAEYDTMSGVDKDSTAYKKYLEARKVQSKALVNEYIKQEETLLAEFSEVEKKSVEKFTQISKKLIEDELKVTEELEKKRFEFGMAAGGVETRVQAYYDYLQATEDRIVAKYSEERQKMLKEYLSWSPEKQAEMLPQVIAGMNASNKAESDAIEKNRVSITTTGVGKIDSNVMKGEKQISSSLANQQAALAIEKEQVWTGDQLNKIEAQNEQLVLKSLIAKQLLYAKEQESLEELIDARVLKGEIVKADDEMILKAKEYKTQLDAINISIDQQKIKVKEANDESFMGNFEQGLRKGTQSLGSFKSMTQDLGSSVVSTFSGDMTNALTGMVDDLGRGENAWKSFASTMGNMLKSIGDMLAKYVMQLLVVWAVQQMVGLVMGGASSAGGKALGTTGGGTFNGVGQSSFGGIYAATGGYITDTGVQHFADGGLSTLGGYIPTNVGIQGKDSVPAMLMPGEYVIKKDMVDLYGVDYLKALNQGKIQKFAEGGSVGGSSSSGASPKDNDGTPYSFSIINVADVNSIPPIDGQAVVNIVSFDAAKKGPTYHTIKGIMQNS